MKEFTYDGTVILDIQGTYSGDITATSGTITMVEELTATISGTTLSCYGMDFTLQ